MYWLVIYKWLLPIAVGSFNSRPAVRPAAKDTVGDTPSDVELEEMLVERERKKIDVEESEFTA